jgi:hypothetical protein
MQPAPVGGFHRFFRAKPHIMALVTRRVNNDPNFFYVSSLMNVKVFILNTRSCTLRGFAGLHKALGPSTIVDRSELAFGAVEI